MLKVSPEEVLRKVYNNTHDAIIIHDLKGSIMDVNSTMCQMYGLEKEEALSCTIRDISGPNMSVGAIFEIWKKVVGNHKEIFFEWEAFRPKDRESFYVEVSLARINFAEDSLIVANIRDITERKKSEAALRESQRQLTTLMGNLPGMAYRCRYDPHWTMLFVSESCYGLTGYRSLDLLESREIAYSDLVHPDDAQMVWDKIRHGLEKSGRFSVEYRILAAGGEEKYVWEQGTGIYEDKQVMFLEGFIADITERKKVEEALKESESRFRRLLADVPSVAVQGYSMQGVTIYWNKASEVLYGYTEQEALGQNLIDLIIPDERRSQVQKEVQHMAESHEPIPSSELILKQKDGSLVPVLSNHTLVHKYDGSLELFCIDIDLTEIKKAQYELVRAKEQAESANQAKSEFLANMSHELRTPLNGIMGMMQLLQLTSLDSEQLEYVVHAANSGKRLTQLLSDLLDIARFDTKIVSLEESEFDVQELCNSVLELFHINAKEKGISIKHSIDPVLPGELVGDVKRIRQILFNLLGNALKFTDEGSVNLAVYPVSEITGKSLRVLFSVSDTGIGIADEDMPNIFNLFFQKDSSLSRKYEGAGLGLPIVQRLVQLMGGNLSVDSTPGLGTAIYVVFPLMVMDKDLLKPDKKYILPETPAQALKILLVEDDPSNQLAMSLLLEKFGHTVVLACDGNQVLDLLAGHDFNCVLMDVQMPVMDGVETTRVIRASEHLNHKRNIPIIALTAYAMDSDRKRFLEAGMDDYLTKPVQKEDLYSVLKKHCG